MDVPDSLCEVFLSFCLLVVTHTALRHLAAFASDFLEVPEQPKKASTNAVADSDGPDGTRWVIMYMHLQLDHNHTIVPIHFKLPLSAHFAVF